MAVKALDSVRNPYFDFQELVHAQQLAAAVVTATSTPLILGPTSSFCLHPQDKRIYDPRDDEFVCLICGDFVPHAQLEAERTTPEPEIELP